ncbi:MAG: class I SAM-dependent methyltransferase [Candidatus Nanoarchaeia archaeon]|nr:class I SAM-dependent methyltransferase [Candidatus Nanoarchaeia archaeon]
MSKIKFKLVNCDFCGLSKLSKLYSAKDNYHKRNGLFSIVKCDKCGLVYTNPQPTKETMSFFYSDSAGYFKPVKTSGKDSWIYHALLREYYDYYPHEKSNKIAKTILFPYYLLTFKKMKSEGMPKFVNEGHLLDIGCSYGNFLSKMKKLGWQVKGIELNKKAAEWGRKNSGLNIINSDIDHLKTNEKFDVITMRMLLEHVYSPKKVLKKVKGLLKPNGTLIISIPNFDGFEARLYGKYAYTLQVPTHLTHFTPKTIRLYLKSSGFKDIKIYYQKVDRDLIVPLEYMNEDGKNESHLLNILSNKLIRKTFVKWFINILCILHKTSRMTIYASK